MKTDLQVIDEVNELLTPERWIQGTWCLKPGEAVTMPMWTVKKEDEVCSGFSRLANDSDVEQMCLDGVLRKVIFNDANVGFGLEDEDVADSLLEQYDRVYDVLEYVCRREDPVDEYGVPTYHSPVSYNDSHPFEDVKLVLKYAREELGQQ
jgi:hypothetical protein